MKKILVIIVCIIILLFVYTIRRDINNKTILYNRTVYKKRSNCMYKTPASFLEFFNNYQIDNHDEIINDPNLNMAKKIFIPCSNDDIEFEIKNMELTRNNYYMIINKCDMFVGKNYLWLFLKEYYGEQIIKLLPKSYITYDKDSMDQFNKEYNKDKLYIMKRNIQRQEGIKITKEFDKLINGLKDEYIIIQELLQNPFILNERKINLRVYILVTIYKNTCSVYVYTNGFMYYTPDFFIKGSLDISRNITTGYIDRKVYEENPLTHDDFRKYLGEDKSKIIFFNVYELIRKIMKPYQDYLIKHQAFPDSLQFQVFGSDIAVNDDLSTILMEINKGPDLNYKDERDGEVKKNLIEDMFNIIGVIKKDKINRFSKIL
jgi:hypothetical protein